MAGKYWSSEEVNILKSNYSSKSLKGTRKLLPLRTDCAIQGQAQRLGFAKKVSHWSDEEVCLLRKEYWNALDLRDLFPNHNYEAILAKAASIGLHRNRHRTQLEPLPTLELTDVEKGYIAGIIDGEGCLSLYTYTGPSPQPAIRISNTNLLILERCQQILRGLGRISPPRPLRKPKGKPLFDYTILGVRQVEAVLREVYPFLVGKREQTKLILHYIRKFRSGNFVLSEVEKIASEMGQLNYRGVGR